LPFSKAEKALFYKGFMGFGLRNAKKPYFIGFLNSLTQKSLILQGFLKKTHFSLILQGFIEFH